MELGAATTVVVVMEAGVRVTAREVVVKVVVERVAA